MIAHRVRGRERAVGANARMQAAALIGEDRAGLQQTRFDQYPERDARLGALAGLGVTSSAASGSIWAMRLRAMAA